MAQPRLTGTWLAAAALVVPLLAGCATSAPPAAVPGSESAGVPSSAAGVPSSAAAAAAVPVPPGQLRITGAVRQPVVLTAAQLAAMPSQSVSVSFGTDRGEERHTEVGSALNAVLDRAGLAPSPGKKHAELSLGVLVIGADGYQALISYGEMAPGLGNRAVLLATNQDGAPLARPRLVVPGDLKGARYVNDVVELHVLRATPTS
jgi:hypothetical protein